jgi:hypothetical protein
MWQQPRQGAALPARVAANSSTPGHPESAAFSSQRRLNQARARPLTSTGLVLEGGSRASTLLLSASNNYKRLEAARVAAASKAKQPRQLLLRTQVLRAPEVQAYDEDTWKNAVRPSSFDARALGVLSPPKNQGSCATCVAFAVVAAAEASISLVQPELGRAIIEQGGLSPQQLHFCESNQRRSCSTGWMFKDAFEVLKRIGASDAAPTFRNGGQLVTNSCMPYRPPEGDDDEDRCALDDAACSRLDYAQGEAAIRCQPAAWRLGGSLAASSRQGMQQQQQSWASKQAPQCQCLVASMHALLRWHARKLQGWHSSC